MSKAYVRSELKQRGKASVLLILKPEYQTEAHVARLRKCFQPSERHKHLARSAGAGSASARPHTELASPGPPMLYLPNLGVAYGQVDQLGWDRLETESAALQEIGGAPPLQPIVGLGSTADVGAAPEVSWGVAKIGAPALWAQGLTGKGVLVAHLDTGVDSAHPALHDAIEAFAEFNATGQPIPGAPVADSSDHGTHTAGIIAGRPGNGRSIGVAPGCKLVSAAVIEGGDPAARLLAGVNWALGFPIKVLNLSLGFPGYFAHYVPLIKTIRAKGVLPIFAAGNFGPGTSCSPANYPQAVAVGAVDQSEEVDANSSSERLTRRTDPQIPDLVMPGIDIISANAGGGYRADGGTSMAAPHASGLAALLWEAFPKATVDQVESAIYESCMRSATLLPDRAGRGLPDGVKALAILTKGTGTRRSVPAKA